MVLSALLVDHGPLEFTSSFPQKIFLDPLPAQDKVFFLPAPNS